MPTAIYDCKTVQGLFQGNFAVLWERSSETLCLQWRSSRHYKSWYHHVLYYSQVGVTASELTGRVWLHHETCLSSSPLGPPCTQVVFLLITSWHNSGTFTAGKETPSLLAMHNTDLWGVSKYSTGRYHVACILHTAQEKTSINISEICTYSLNILLFKVYRKLKEPKSNQTFHTNRSKFTGIILSSVSGTQWLNSTILF